MAWAAPARAEVQLRIEGGYVSLKATNATVREILAEWSRVGRTKIVNGERMPGGPITIELNGISEEEALEIILRSAAGYVTAPRAIAELNASRYDRILVMPTSSPTRPASSPAPNSFQQPPPQQFPQQFPPQFPAAVPAAIPGRQPQFPPQFPPQRPVNDDGDADVQDDPAPNVVLPNGAAPVFNSVPAPMQQPAGSFVPRRPAGQPPAGVSVPGMVVPAPQQQQPSHAAAAGDGAGPARTVVALIDEVSAAIADAMRRQDAAAAERAEDAQGGADEPRGRERRARSTTRSRARWSASLVKQRRDSIEQFQKGGRQDLVDKEAAEIAVLESYLPAAADPAVVERAVADAIAETGARRRKTWAA